MSIKLARLSIYHTCRSTVLPPNIPPLEVLFIGDSLTYVNDLDQRVALLVREAGLNEDFVIDRVVKGGGAFLTFPSLLLLPSPYSIP